MDTTDCVSTDTAHPDLYVVSLFWDDGTWDNLPFCQGRGRWSGSQLCFDFCSERGRLMARVRGRAVGDGSAAHATECRDTVGLGTSLAVQWLRIHLAVQGMWVQSLVRELRSHMPWGN